MTISISQMFDDIVKKRRSVRKFNINARFDHDAVTRSLERAVLSPNSSNLQLWEFYRIQSDTALQKMIPYCLHQNAARTAKELIVIVVRKDLWKSRCQWNVKNQGDFFAQKFVDNPKKQKKLLRYWKVYIPVIYTSGFMIFDLVKYLYISIAGLIKPMMRMVTHKEIFISAHRSAALAAQTFMLSIEAEGYNSCPMEGFDKKRVKKFLQLPLSSDVSMIIAVGSALEDGIYGPRLRLPYQDVVYKL